MNAVSEGPVFPKTCIVNFALLFEISCAVNNNVMVEVPLQQSPKVTLSVC